MPEQFGAFLIEQQQHLEIYEGLRALGAHVLQFIPIVEPTGRGKVSPRTVLPEQFGAFLIEVFEKWRAGDIGCIFGQHFGVHGSFLLLVDASVGTTAATTDVMLLGDLRED